MFLSKICPVYDVGTPIVSGRARLRPCKQAHGVELEKVTSSLFEPQATCLAHTRAKRCRFIHQERASGVSHTQRVHLRTRCLRSHRYSFLRSGSGMWERLWTGLMLWAKGGCKEEMPQSRWGRHSIFSLECISRNFILTFPNTKDPSSNPFVAHIMDLWDRYFSWIWLKNKSTILFKDLGVLWDLVTMIASFPSEKEGYTFIKLSIVTVTYYVRWF